MYGTSLRASSALRGARPVGTVSELFSTSAAPWFRPSPAAATPSPSLAHPGAPCRRRPRRAAPHPCVCTYTGTFLPQAEADKLLGSKCAGTDSFVKYGAARLATELKWLNCTIPEVAHTSGVRALALHRPWRRPWPWCSSRCSSEADIEVYARGCWLAA